MRRTAARWRVGAAARRRAAPRRADRTTPAPGAPGARATARARRAGVGRQKRPLRRAGDRRRAAGRSGGAPRAAAPVRCGIARGASAGRQARRRGRRRRRPRTGRAGRRVGMRRRSRRSARSRRADRASPSSMRSSSTGRQPSSVAGCSGIRHLEQERARLVREAREHVERVAPEREGSRATSRASCRARHHDRSRLSGGAGRRVRAERRVLYRPRCRPAPAARSCRPGRASSSCASCRSPRSTDDTRAPACRGVRHLRQRRRAVHRHHPGAAIRSSRGTSRSA